MTVFISLAIGCYLLIPYYLGLLTLDPKKTNTHILIWCACNAIFSLVFSWKEKEMVTLPLVVLGVGFVYFVCSYLFYGRELQKETKGDHISILISNPNVLRFLYIAFAGIIVVSLLLFFYMTRKTDDLLYVVYFLVVMFISCAEMVLYFRTIRRTYQK